MGVIFLRLILRDIVHAIFFYNCEEVSQKNKTQNIYELLCNIH